MDTLLGTQPHTNQHNQTPFRSVLCNPPATRLILGTYRKNVFCAHHIIVYILFRSKLS